MLHLLIIIISNIVLFHLLSETRILFSATFITIPSIYSILSLGLLFSMTFNPKNPCYSLLRPLISFLYHMCEGKNTSHFDIRFALKSMYSILLFQM